MAESIVTASKKPATAIRTGNPAELAAERASPAKKPRPLPAMGALTEPNAAEIQHMIAEAAYYLAERRSFAPGFEQEDWATATAEVMAQLKLDIM